jgi:hypothetical protein
MPRDDQPIELAAFTSDLPARALVMHLREEGIVAEAIGGMLAGFRAEAPALVRVMVRRCDEAAAKAIMKSVAQESAQIDWASVDVGAPIAGENFMSQPADSASQTPAPSGKPLWFKVLVIAMIGMVGFLAVWQAFRGLTAWLSQTWPAQSGPLP